MRLRGAAQAAQFVRIILAWREACEGRELASLVLLVSYRPLASLVFCKRASTTLGGADFAVSIVLVQQPFVHCTE